MIVGTYNMYTIYSIYTIYCMYTLLHRTFRFLYQIFLYSLFYATYVLLILFRFQYDKEQIISVSDDIITILRSQQAIRAKLFLKKRLFRLYFSTMCKESPYKNFNLLHHLVLPRCLKVFYLRILTLRAFR